MKVKIERSIHFAMSDYKGRTVSIEEVSPMFIGYQTNPSGGTSDKHVRFFYVVHVIVGGEGVVVVGNERHTIKKGDVFIVKPYVPIIYDYKPNNNLKYAWIGFMGSIGKKLDGVPSVCSLSVDYYERIKTLVDENEIVYAEPVCEILLDIINEIYERESNGVLSKVKEYIDENFQSELSIEELAKEFSYNRTYLGRVFKKEYGVSPKEYLLSKRLNSALNMLIKGERVKDACYKSGFSNPYNFSRYFKEKYGVPPRNIYAKSKQKDE